MAVAHANHERPVRLLIRHLPHDVTADQLFDVISARCDVGEVRNLFDISVLSGYPRTVNHSSVCATAVVEVRPSQHRDDDNAACRRLVWALADVFDGRPAFGGGQCDAVSVVERSPVYLGVSALLQRKGGGDAESQKRRQTMASCRPNTIEDDEDYRRFCAAQELALAEESSQKEDDDDDGPPGDSAEKAAPVSRLVQALLAREERRRTRTTTKARKKRKAVPSAAGVRGGRRKKAEEEAPKKLLRRNDPIEAEAAVPDDAKAKKVRTRKSRRQKVEGRGDAAETFSTAPGEAGEETKLKKKRKSRRELERERRKKRDKKKRNTQNAVGAETDVDKGNVFGQAGEAQGQLTNGEEASKVGNTDMSKKQRKREKRKQMRQKEGPQEEEERNRRKEQKKARRQKRGARQNPLCLQENGQAGYCTSEMTKDCQPELKINNLTLLRRPHVDVHCATDCFEKTRFDTAAADSVSLGGAAGEKGVQGGQQSKQKIIVPGKEITAVCD